MTIDKVAERLRNRWSKAETMAANSISDDGSTDNPQFDHYNQVAIQAYREWFNHVNENHSGAIIIGAEE